jgi:hypothetical protein
VILLAGLMSLVAYTFALYARTRAPIGIARFARPASCEPRTSAPCSSIRRAWAIMASADVVARITLLSLT